MTYMKLLEALKRMNPEELAMDVTVYSRGADEFYPAESMLTVIEEHNNDVYLVIDG